MPTRAETAPLQIRGRRSEQPRRGFIEMGDLKIGRPAMGVPYRGEGDNSLVCRGKHGSQQIVTVAPFVDIGADQRAAPPRPRRQRENVVGVDQTFAYAMCDTKIGLTILQRAGGGFIQRSGAIERQTAERRIPGVRLQPGLDVTADPRNFERRAIAPEQQNIVREPAETSEHYLFVARQRLPRPNRGAPFAL